MKDTNASKPPEHPPRGKRHHGIQADSLSKVSSIGATELDLSLDLFTNVFSTLSPSVPSSWTLLYTAQYCIVVYGSAWHCTIVCMHVCMVSHIAEYGSTG